ncbi:D-allose transporter substrate-binding protein [Iocasia frigidifontis]|uniref:D-allose transporter substrate-binding protein n=1 Tax=Iocasia fonsfrigidae TaxID=2682810 RepID=A0A8A7KFQ3_9FIRM|nr:D-allose transporter substrate-binding protein [Iocasia fonsfrigidae]QTL96692.1 D-allose transporter substrate-binding protein [Iocasia fonsfrigidae]
MRKITILMLVLFMVGTTVGIAMAESSLQDVKANGDYKIGIILKTLANPFWVSMEQGILDEAEKQGVEVDIYAVSQEGDANEQLRLFENLLNKDYDGIAFAPITPVNLIPSIVKANDQGVPVVNLDERVPQEPLRNRGGFVYSFVTTNNVKVGGQAAEFVIEQLPDGGKVAVIEGMAGNASGEDRKMGFTNIIRSNSKFEIVASQPADWDRIKAIDVTRNIMTRNPDVKAIYACNDTMALGAVKALENMGKLDEVIVVGTDGIPEAVKSVEEGRLSSTVKQDPYNIGVTGLRLLIQALNIPAEVEVPSIVVK